MERWEKDCINAISVNSMIERGELLRAVQWTGSNLEQVIDFVGKSPRFNEWFNSWEEYEQYVKEHNNIVKLFSHTGYNVEVKVGEWIVKLPDGTNVPVRNCWLKEPVSKDLSDLIDKLSKRYPEVSFAKLARIVVAATKWQIEQFEKNRLDACDRLTKEEAERESDFVIRHIEEQHCTPTFDDAIKYGIMLEHERLMKDAVDGWVARDKDGDIAIFREVPTKDAEIGMWKPCKSAYIFPNKDEYPDVTWDSEPQKVKVIIIPSEEI